VSVRPPFTTNSWLLFIAARFVAARNITCCPEPLIATSCGPLTVSARGKVITPEQPKTTVPDPEAAAASAPNVQLFSTITPAGRSVAARAAPASGCAPIHGTAIPTATSVAKTSFPGLRMSPLLRS
jgi:hypothetical protein